MPCIETGTGICHIYVDQAADLDMGHPHCGQRKTKLPSVCNAAEVCLVHQAVAGLFLPMLSPAHGRKAHAAAPVPARGGSHPGTPAGPDDFDTEFLDYILAVRVVGSLEEAVAHIAAPFHRPFRGHRHCGRSGGAGPSAPRWDSAAGIVNASTRFTDGGEFGFGCEMGISTQKLGARGPMELAGAMLYKYIIRGAGQTRQSTAKRRDKPMA